MNSQTSFMTDASAAINNSSSTAAVRRLMQTNADMLATTCPGDWNRAPNRRLRAELLAYAAGEEGDLSCDDYLINLMLFRLKMTLFADGVVDHFRLFRPFGQSLLYWDRLEWSRQHPRDPKRTWIQKAMTAQGLVFCEKTWGPQAMGFERSHQYLAAAIYESNLDTGTMEQIMEAIGVLILKGLERSREEGDGDGEDPNRILFYANRELSTLREKLKHQVLMDEAYRSAFI